MTLPTKKTLLRELDALSHPGRVARLGRLGRDHAGSAELQGLIASLESGDWYEAWLAVELARAAREPSAVARALRSPSLRVRSRAAVVAAALCDEATLEQALEEATPETRERLVKGLAHEDRTALADRLFPTVLSRHGAVEAARLLPAMSAQPLAAALPEVEHVVRNWRPLVVRHPEVVLGLLRQRFASSPEHSRPALFGRFDAALRELCLARPAEVLALALEHAPADVLPAAVEGALGVLTRAQPDAVIALLSRPAFLPVLTSRGLPRGVLASARSLRPEQRRQLAALIAPQPHHLAALLAALPPSERSALFQHAYPDRAPRVLPEALLQVLPHALRDAEAARMLGLKEVQDDAGLQRRMQSHRAIEHAREPLSGATRAAKAEERAEAWALLIRCTGASRRGLEETLGRLSRLKNEQDPVRLAALQALAQVPSSLFREEHVPALWALVEWVTEARDTSESTRSALQSLAFRLMRANAMEAEGALFRFSLQTLQRLAKQAGRIALPPLERDLPRGAELRILSALLPMLRDAGAREDYGLVLTLTMALGRRAWTMDLLRALLKPVLDAKPDAVARAAVGLWLAPPKTRDARVRELLDGDQTVIAHPAVFAHLHRRRQEWLDPFLAGRRLKGRFLEGKGGYVPPASEGFFRWLPRQQEALLDLLLQVAADAKRSAWERIGAVQVLSRLQVTGVATLAPFLQEKDVPTCEAALGALVWLDRPEPALPVLLEHLDGDRARVAMYALPRISRLVSGEVLGLALRGLLRREKLKVTVHKEALRLLGQARSAQSLPLLLEEAAKPALHRDVRIAVGHAARQLLDDERAWALVGAIAKHADPDIAASLLDQSRGALPARLRPRYGSLVIELVGHPAAPVRQRALALLPAWSAGIEDAAGTVAQRWALELQSGAEWRDAVRVLVTIALEGPPSRFALATGRGLLLPPAAQPNATVDRDLPARQRLLALCQELLGLPAPARQRLREPLFSLAEVLGGDPSLWPWSSALRLATLSWRDLAQARALIERLMRELAEEPLFQPGLAAQVRYSLQQAPGWSPEAVLALANELELAPLVCVQLVAAAGAQTRWRPEMCEALRRLREHPGAAVRAAARDAVTHAEA